MPNVSVVGIDADEGSDIVMVTVRNQYKHLHGAPRRDFLLLTQALDKAGQARMMRVVGITKQMMTSWHKGGEVPFEETTPEIESILREYFAAREERLHRLLGQKLQGPATLSKLIH
jgi:hypothetical protein